MILFMNEKVAKGIEQLRPVLKGTLEEMDNWLHEHYQKDLLIVETITTMEEDIKLKRVSASHQEGRAVDIRIRDWPEEMIEAFEAAFLYLNELIGAVSAEDGKPRFIVHKPHGTGPHFHCQIGRDVHS